MQVNDEQGNEYLKNWNEMTDEQRKAAKEAFQAADVLGFRAMSVAFHRPGSVITAKDGKKYRIAEDGSRRRIEDD